MIDNNEQVCAISDPLGLVTKKINQINESLNSIVMYAKQLN